MLIYGHRGFHLRAVENTIPAFADAVDAGVDGIETDVRLSADGSLILHHDRDAPDGRPVAQLTRAELGAALGISVPTLEDALDGFPQVIWNVEIKTSDALPRTLEVLGRFAATRRLLVSSFLHPLVAEVYARLKLDCGLLAAHRPLDAASVLAWFPPSMPVKRIICDYQACDRALVEDFAKRGIRCLVYGPKTSAELAEVALWPLEGLITDRPDLLLR